MASFIKKLFVGALLLTSGAFAARDVCQGPYSHICDGNLGIARHQMPQVQGRVARRFLEEMAREGRHIEQREIDPRRVFPIQNEMNEEIIQNMDQREGYDPCQTEPIFVNFNGTHFQVIDGHHRWASCRMKAERLKESVKQVAIIIYNTGVNILDRLRNFPGVFQINFDVV